MRGSERALQWVEYGRLRWTVLGHETSWVRILNRISDVFFVQHPVAGLRKPSVLRSIAGELANPEG